MATSATTTLAGALPDEPRVRRIGARELGVALRMGVDDFRAKPSHILFLELPLSDRTGGGLVRPDELTR